VRLEGKRVHDRGETGRQTCRHGERIGDSAGPRGEVVPTAIDPAPEATSRLIDAVIALLPDIARQGAAELSDDELPAPFRSYLRAVAQ
jgi:hypothetical protein